MGLRSSVELLEAKVITEVLVESEVVDVSFDGAGWSANEGWKADAELVKVMAPGGALTPNGPKMWEAQFDARQIHHSSSAPPSTDDEGRLIVRKGQRRTLAAVRANLPTVRVLIEPESDVHDDDTTGQVDRIIDQYGENYHRASISQADEARAHQQLLDLGLSAGQIARRTHTPTKRVRAIGMVNRSDRAREALASYPLTIDQAAVIAELDDGTTPVTTPRRRSPRRPRRTRSSSGTTLSGSATNWPSASWWPSTSPR